jgi:hypothetical protein
VKKLFQINDGVSQPTNIAPGVTIRSVPDHMNEQRRQLVLIIDEHTDFKVVNRSRKTLTKLFREMEFDQGINLNYPIRGNQYGFYQWRTNGMGPKALTSILNYIGLALILNAYELKQNEENLDVCLEDNLWIPGFPLLFNANFSEQLFHYIAIAAGITPEESVFHINQGHHFFAKNRLPWRIKKGPFNEQKINSKVDYFKELIETKIITISQVDSQFNRLEFSIYWLHEQGYLKKINYLLDKKGGESWKRTNLKIKTQMKQIIENWDTSEIPQIISMRKMCAGLTKFL